ncbi:MAG: sugar phosphate isomerase/epimerase family protein [Candidatus Aenigmatarchaeota archaeon]
MKLGAMNNPSKNVLDEIEWIGQNGFEFVDLTIEPSKAYFDDINAGEIKRLLYRYGMDCVGHTAYYMPMASPIKALREASISELLRAMDFFSKLRVQKMNVHLDRPHMLFSKEQVFSWHVEVLNQLVSAAKQYDIQIMIENGHNKWCSEELMLDMLARVPGLMFHLDVAHFFINHGSVDGLDAFLQKIGDKLVHVHAHDNFGTDDLHLPIGAGNINWETVVQALKNNNYNDTITIELHSPDKQYFIYSRDKFKKLWHQM